MSPPSRRGEILASLTAVVALALLAAVQGVGGDGDEVGTRRVPSPDADEAVHATTTTTTTEFSPPNVVVTIPDAPGYGLGERDPRVKHWRRAWRNAFERAWSDAYTTPAAFAHDGQPESRRRILQVLTQSTSYSGFNFPGSTGKTDRPYVLPLQWSPPPPGEPPSPRSPPPPPDVPAPPPPYPAVRARAWRGAQTSPASAAIVDLFVEYVG